MSFSLSQLGWVTLLELDLKEIFEPLFPNSMWESTYILHIRAKEACRVSHFEPLGQLCPFDLV